MNPADDNSRDVRSQQRENELRQKLEERLRVKLGIDSLTDTEEGRLAAWALDWYLDLRRAWARERAQLAALQKRRQGRALNGYAGYGYKLVGPRGRRRKVPDPPEQRVIADIVRWRTEGYTWEAIYFHLLSNRVRHRGKEWSLARIRRADAAAMSWATTAMHPRDPAA